MPSQAEAQASARVRAYPALERHRLVWVWPAIRRAPTPRSCPTCTGTTIRNGRATGTLFAKCDYRLMVDNLMDLTHETFVHATSIGHSAIAETPSDHHA